MEIDSIKEMFHRSEKQYRVKYTHFIGDGDSKTYKGVVESKPYGDTIEIQKKSVSDTCRNAWALDSGNARKIAKTLVEKIN